MNHRPVCSKCQVELRPTNNDAMVVDHAYDPPQPYKIWCADEWTCPKCGYQIVIGFGDSPIAHHFEPEFQPILSSIKAKNLILNFEFTT